MKIVVVGGSGRIGSRVANKLRDHGHAVLVASRASGVDAYANEGLADAVDGATVVVDVIDAPAHAPGDFFPTTARHIQAAERQAGVLCHVVLSVLGVDRVPDSDYFRGKLAQEQIVKDGNIPFTIVRSTQFFESTVGIAEAAADGQRVRLAPVHVQPVAADDVATKLAHIAVGMPLDDIIEIAGPEQFRLDQLAQRVLGARGDQREVVADGTVPYFGARLEIDSRALLPDLFLARTHLADWVGTPALLR